MSTSTPRPLVGVVADDITGADDIGVMFAKHGYAVRIFGAGTDLAALPGRLAGRRTDVIIIDTDSRMDEPQVAYAKVRRATAALVRAGCGLFWKKTCSVFRGNVGPEFDALFDELNHRFALAVAAFPKNGRVTGAASTMCTAGSWPSRSSPGIRCIPAPSRTWWWTCSGRPAARWG